MGSADFLLSLEVQELLKTAYARPAEPFAASEVSKAGRADPTAFELALEHLLAQRDLYVVLLVPVEIEQRHIAERADSGDLRRGYVLARRELLQRRHHLVAGGEHDGKGALASCIMKQFGLHDRFPS